MFIFVFLFTVVSKILQLNQTDLAQLRETLTSDEDFKEVKPFPKIKFENKPQVKVILDTKFNEESKEENKSNEIQEDLQIEFERVEQNNKANFLMINTSRRELNPNNKTKIIEHDKPVGTEVRNFFLAQALWDSEIQDVEELEFKTGDILKISNSQDDEWFFFFF